MRWVTEFFADSQAKYLTERGELVERLGIFQRTRCAKNLPIKSDMANSPVNLQILITSSRVTLCVENDTEFCVITKRTSTRIIDCTEWYCNSMKEHAQEARYRSNRVPSGLDSESSLGARTSAS